MKIWTRNHFTVNLARLLSYYKTCLVYGCSLVMIFFWLILAVTSLVLYFHINLKRKSYWVQWCMFWSRMIEKYWCKFGILCSVFHIFYLGKFLCFKKPSYCHSTVLNKLFRHSNQRFQAIWISNNRLF